MWLCLSLNATNTHPKRGEGVVVSRCWLSLLIVSYLLAFASASETCKDEEDCSAPVIRTYTLYYGREIVLGEDTLSKVPIATCREIKEEKQALRQSFLFDDDRQNNQATKVTASTVPMKYGKIGARIWPSGIALSLYLAGTGVARGKRTLELASGAGLPSMTAMKVGGAEDVMATDYWMDVAHQDVSSLGAQDALGRKRTWEVPTREFGANLEGNLGAERVRRLDYHNESEVSAVSAHFQPELIFGSDMIYFHKDTDSIIKCAQSLMRYNGERVLFLSPLPSNDGRGSLESFTTTIQKWALQPSISFRTVEVSLCCTGYQCERPKEGNGECGDYIIIEIIRE